MRDAARRFGLSQADKESLLRAVKAKGAAAPSRGRRLDGAAAPAAPELARFDAMPSWRAVEERLASFRRAGIENGFYLLHEARAGRWAFLGGRRLLNFATYDYLALNGDPRLQKAAADAARDYGMSASASRLTAGERPPHRELERLVAESLGTEDCMCYVSGHAANVSTLCCLLGPKDAVFCDALCHNSLMLGAQYSGARRFVHPAGDLEALERLLEERRPSCERALVAAEGLYGMDGYFCDLPRLSELRRRHRCLLMVDEAHSMGVAGPRGLGVADHFGLGPDAADVWMGTLSKSFCGCGGYIAGSKALVDLLRYAAPGFVYSVGMPPPMAAASAEALRIMLAEPWRVERLQASSRRFLELARERGLDTGRAEGAGVVPVMVGGTIAAVALAQILRERGVLVNVAFHPGVEEGKARLRLFISAHHEEEDLRLAADAIARALPEAMAWESSHAE